MILLDTDHASLLKDEYDSDAARRLIHRLEAVNRNEILVSIVTIEEHMRGWLAVIAKERLAERQVVAYRELEKLFSFYIRFEIASFDQNSASRFDELRKLKLKVGSMDLKIAAIALVKRATVLSRNLRDFRRIPGLNVEDWTL